MHCPGGHAHWFVFFGHHGPGGNACNIVSKCMQNNCTLNKSMSSSIFKVLVGCLQPQIFATL